MTYYVPRFLLRFSTIHRSSFFKQKKARLALFEPARVSKGVPVYRSVRAVRPLRLRVFFT